MARQDEKKDAQESTIPRDMLASERAAHALHLRRMGFTYDEIAEQCGYANESGPRKAVKKALNRVIHHEARELAEETLQLQLDRIDMALSQAVMPQMTQGERLQAVNTLITVLKHQAELLDLYPTPARDTSQPPTVIFRHSNFDSEVV